VGGSGSQTPLGQPDQLSTFQGALVRKDSCQSDVCGLNGIRISLAGSPQEFDELMHQMRMRSAVSGALGKAEVILAAFAAVDSALSERGDLVGEQVSVVGAGDPLGDLWLGFFRGVDDEGLVFNEGPLDGFFGSVDFDALAILAGHVEEGAVDLGAEIALVETDVGRLDGEGRAVAAVHFLADRAAGETAYVLGLIAGESEDGADAVGGIVHRGKARPVARPAVHVLLVTCFEKLQLAEFALVVELLHEKKFTGVDDRFHHHVVQAGFLTKLYDGLAILDGGCHRHCAGNVFACAQCREGVLGVIWNRRVDVDCVNVRIGEDVGILLIALFDTELVADLFEGFGIPLADRGHFRIRMALIDGYEFGTEAETDDGDAGFANGLGHRKRKKLGTGQ
jgi:hypothetical protein